MKSYSMEAFIVVRFSWDEGVCKILFRLFAFTVFYFMLVILLIDIFIINNFHFSFYLIRIEFMCVY